ncbi:MAG: helix-turn-helix transcriptional regulator [Anaerolineae bacterium]|nr:helix-turn-helix transcriptional regulator [Anaerolineae bacterium]
MHNFWTRWHDEAGHTERWQDFFRDFMGTLPNKHWIFGGRRFKPWRMGQIDFNPFLAMLLSKGGGLLAVYVLNLLNRTPQYGNEIMQEIVRRTEGRWSENPGAVYPLLSMLEQLGFIEGDWEDPDKRTIRRYHITPAGEDELDRLVSVIKPRLREAIEVMSDILADLED